VSLPGDSFIGLFGNRHSATSLIDFFDDVALHQAEGNSMRGPRDSLGNPLIRSVHDAEVEGTLRGTETELSQSVHEEQGLIRDEESLVAEAGGDPTETALRKTIMRVLTPLLAVADLIKSGLAFAQDGFTVTGLIDSVADVSVLGNMVRRYCVSGDIVGYGFVYQLVALSQALEGLNGIGAPDTGQTFGSGASMFGELGESAHNARPRPAQWFGPAAETYAAITADQEALAGRLAGADQYIAELLHTQADYVGKVRVGLASVKGTFVTLALLLQKSEYALYKNFLPEARPVVVRIFAGVVIGGLIAELGLLITAIVAGQQSAASARKAIAAYADVAAAADALAQGPRR